MEGSTINVRIKNYSEDLVNGKSKTFYNIEVKATGNKWGVSKRFNDFGTLNEKLKKLHGNLPILPKKTFFALKKESDKEERKKQLESYLKMVVQRDDILGDRTFRDFLEVYSLVSFSLMSTLRR